MSAARKTVRRSKAKTYPEQNDPTRLELGNNDLSDAAKWPNSGLCELQKSRDIQTCSFNYALSEAG